MGQAIGGWLALAIGIALSPVPIIAVVLMLTSLIELIPNPKSHFAKGFIP